MKKTKKSRFVSNFDDQKSYNFQRLNALGADGKEDDGVRRAIAAEANRQPVDPNKLPKVSKTPAESDLIMEALMSNTFMANMAQNQLQKVGPVTVS